MKIPVHQCIFAAAATSVILQFANLKISFRIESSDDGGGVGINIGGMFISANCSIILIIMAFIFVLVGAILTGISYRPRDLGEELERFLSRQEWGGHLKIIGPVFLVIGKHKYYFNVLH